jgi:hypothetical protein
MEGSEGQSLAGTLHPSERLGGVSVRTVNAREEARIGIGGHAVVSVNGWRWWKSQPDAQ